MWCISDLSLLSFTSPQSLSPIKLLIMFLTVLLKVWSVIILLLADVMIPTLIRIAVLDGPIGPSCPASCLQQWHEWMPEKDEAQGWYMWYFPLMLSCPSAIFNPGTTWVYLSPIHTCFFITSLCLKIFQISQVHLGECVFPGWAEEFN